MTARNLFISQTLMGSAIGLPSLFVPKMTLQTLVHAEINDLSVLLTRLLGCFFLIAASLLPWLARRTEALHFRYGVLLMCCLLNFGLAVLLTPGIVVAVLRVWGIFLFLGTVLLGIAQFWYLVKHTFWLPR